MLPRYRGTRSRTAFRYRGEACTASCGPFIRNLGSSGMLECWELFRCTQARGEMTLRPRDPRKVRTDAIQMAVKKARAGCWPCAEGYFNLARENGATWRRLPVRYGAGRERDVV